MRQLMIVVLLLSCMVAVSQEDQVGDEKKVRPFVAYELGEAVFNSFKSYSGEVGLKFQNDHLLRLVHMNLSLTEAHLSSSFAGAVDGPDVEGEVFGFEGFYDLPVITKGLYVAPSLGYYKTEYRHLLLDESFMKKSATVGAAISYRETDIFGIKGLYYTFSIPMRISLNASDESLLGETIIKNDTFENNIWLFIGYQF